MKHQSVRRSKARIAVGSALVVAFVTAYGVKFSSAAAPHGEEEHVREALIESAAGFEKGDMTVLNKVWANDESVIVFESGHANYGWADYRDRHLMPEMKEMKNTKYTLSDIKVKMAGTTAWATFKYTISADVGARHVDGGGLGTAVLEKREGRWQIVHWHSSAPRRAPVPASSPAKN